MDNLTFELGEEIKIKTSLYCTGLILARGIIEGIDGSYSEMYLVFYQGEKKGYFSQYELEKK